jgi:hypothetical protein
LRLDAAPAGPATRAAAEARQDALAIGARPGARYNRIDGTQAIEDGNDACSQDIEQPQHEFSLANHVGKATLKEIVRNSPIA